MYSTVGCSGKSECGTKALITARFPAGMETPWPASVREAQGDVDQIRPIQAVSAGPPRLLEGYLHRRRPNFEFGNTKSSIFAMESHRLPLFLLDSLIGNPATLTFSS